MLVSHVESQLLSAAGAIDDDSGWLEDQCSLTQGAQAPPAIVQPAVRDGPIGQKAERSALAPPVASECLRAKIH